MNKTPRWEQQLQLKHREQMLDHERMYGKLGSLQTKTQKAALKKANAKLEADGIVQPLYKQGEPEPSRYKVVGR